MQTVTREFSRGFILPALVEGTGWEVAKETGAVLGADQGEDETEDGSTE